MKNEKPQPTYRAPTTPVVLLLSLEEVAAATRTSVRTVRALRSKGMLPEPLRLGDRNLRWRLTDIQEFLARQPGIPVGGEPEQLRAGRQRRKAAAEGTA